MQVFREIQGAPAPIGPYSAATLSGNLLFCAGQIPLVPGTGKLIEGGIKEQTEQVLKNLEAVLRGGGSSPDKILMTTIFLIDINDGKVVNPIYASFVSAENPPARQTVAVKELPMGSLVEISVIAEVESHKK